MAKKKAKHKLRDWEWFGHPAHFICGDKCRFHLATKVGKYLVSTVGEHWPERPSREIHAKTYDKVWFEKNNHLKGDVFDSAYFKRFGFQEIGLGRKYETMVFLAGKPCSSNNCGCGLPSISGGELDFIGYNNAADAKKGHMRLCAKWSKKNGSNDP